MHISTIDISSRGEMKGNLINWDTSEWKLTNMSEIEVEHDNLCQPVRPGHVIMSVARNFSYAVNFCQKLKAEMSVITNKEMQEELINKTLQTEGGESIF